MKKLAFIIIAIMFSCSEDSMDIPQPVRTYDVTVKKDVMVVELTYSNSSKTEIIQSRYLQGLSKDESRILFEFYSIPKWQKDDLVEKYNGKTEITFTDMGTVINYQRTITTKTIVK